MGAKTIDLTGEKYFRGTLPSGRIHKGFTGIGATTAEIRNKKRNSIIVMPTKSLAATKAISENILYVGSTFSDVTSRSSKYVLNKLRKKNKELIKIAVVADSFVKLFNEIGEELVKDEHNFFLMFDEIDSFQSESNYRPKLEECIDIYFKFRKPENRCMISATLQDSHDNEIKGQELTKFIKKDVKPIELDVVNCKHDIVVSAAKLIKKKYDLLKKHDKILVAYNRVDKIRLVISLLELYGIDKSEIKILAGEGSKEKLKQQESGELEASKLPAKINFITAAYYVGVDVKENTHTLVVADTEIYYTTPAKAKIIQILGRTRGKLKSAALLLKFRPERCMSLKEYEFFVKEEIERSLKSYNCIKSFAPQYPDSELLQRQAEGFAEASVIDGVKLLRKVDDEFKKARLAMDFLMHNQKAWNTLYHDKASLLKELEEQPDEFQIDYFEDNVAPTTSELEIIQVQQNFSREEKVERSLTMLGRLQAKLFLGPSPITDFELMLDEIISKIKRTSIDKKKAYRRLEALAKDQNTKEMKKLHKKVKLLTLSENHPFWINFHNHFQKGKPYERDEIRRKLQKIEVEVQDPSVIEQGEIRDESYAVRFLNTITKTTRTTVRTERNPNDVFDNKQVKGPKIKSFLTLESVFD